MTSTLNLRAAVRHLKAADPILAGIIERVGPCRWETHPAASVFEALAQAIVYQQLHGRAALTIHNRVLDLYPKRVPDPARCFEISDDLLRLAGLSRAKLASMRDLAAKAMVGELPTMAEAGSLTDDQLVARLTAVRGIGPWTVHMFLMARLGRPDVLPTGDFGIREAFKVNWRKRRQPTPEELEKHARKWRPWRTVACWYLWRSLDG